jgi:hypothetical protein
MNDPRVADTWQQFLSQVRDARRELGASDVIWYRGHPSPDYTLRRV